MLRKSLVVIVGGLTALLALTGCSMFGPGPMHGAGQIVVATEHQHGGHMTLQQGDTLAVHLRASPSTGYRWETSDVDESRLHLMSEAFVADSDSVGAGGVQILKFRAINTGETTLQFVYRRPWETDVEPQETFRLDVTIR